VLYIKQQRYKIKIIQRNNLLFFAKIQRNNLLFSAKSYRKLQGLRVPREQLALQVTTCLFAKIPEHFSKVLRPQGEVFRGETPAFLPCFTGVRLGGGTSYIPSTTFDKEPISLYPQSSEIGTIKKQPRNLRRCRIGRFFLFLL